MPPEQVVIIGAGPAGLAAALQLQRSGATPLVLEKNHIGGLLNNANLVENYPGFVGGVAGPHLAELMHQQLKTWSVRIAFEQVTRLERRHGLFALETEKGRYQAQRVIVASGTEPVKPDDVDIAPEAADRVFYEVFDLRQAAGEAVAVVGAGDAAFDYALNLSRQNTICLLNRGNRIKALPLLVERVRASSAIAYEQNVCVNTITCEHNSYVSLQGRQNGHDYQIEADAVVFAIGREPQLDFLAPELHERIDNLYFTGDVKNGRFRQTAIAVADGIKAAMTIHNQLQERDI